MASCAGDASVDGVEEFGRGGDGGRDGSGEEVSTGVEGLEREVATDGGWDGPCDGVVMEAEVAKPCELADAFGEAATEAMPGEYDGDDHALDALDVSPITGAGVEASVILGAEETVGVSVVVLDGLQALVVGLADDDVVSSSVDLVVGGRPECSSNVG